MKIKNQNGARWILVGQAHGSSPFRLFVSATNTSSSDGAMGRMSAWGIFTASRSGVSGVTSWRIGMRWKF